MSDDDVARLHQGGTSYRQIARELGISLAGVQRALQRRGVIAKPAPPVAPVEFFEDLPDPDQWHRLSAIERWRLNHHIPVPVPIHDDDHALCCVAHDADPNYVPDFAAPSLTSYRPRTLPTFEMDDDDLGTPPAIAELWADDGE